VRQIFQEYADSLNIDLEFQGFESELAALPANMLRPVMILLARVDGSIALLRTAASSSTTPTTPMPPR
jgi:hypothetical protein